jgi:hypothetical protein
MLDLAQLRHCLQLFLHMILAADMVSTPAYDGSTTEISHSCVQGCRQQVCSGDASGQRDAAGCALPLVSNMALLRNMFPCKCTRNAGVRIINN